MKPKILTLLTLFTFFSSLHTATIHGLLFINPWDVHYVEDSSDSTYWHAILDSPNTSINGTLIVTIRDSTDDTLYCDTSYFSGGEFYIQIPEINIPESVSPKPPVITITKDLKVINQNNIPISITLSSISGRAISRATIPPGSYVKLSSELPHGVYILRTSVGESYKITVIDKNTITGIGRETPQTTSPLKISKIAGERNKNIELRIIPNDTTLHQYLAYPYWPEETITNKELLIGLIPRQAHIYNPWTNQIETVRIDRNELLDINTTHNYNDPEYLVYTDGPCPERPIQKIYLQGFPDTQAIIDTLQALADWMNTQIDSSGLRPYTWPRLVPDPRIIPVKDTTGIVTLGDIPLGAVAILYSTGGGATATDEWNDISNVAHYERWLARGISWADIDYVVNEILKAYLSTYDVTLYFSINGQGGGIKRTTPKDMAHLIIYHNATNHKWEELAGNTPIEVYAYPEGIPIEDTLKHKGKTYIKHPETRLYIPKHQLEKEIGTNHKNLKEFEEKPRETIDKKIRIKKQ